MKYILITALIAATLFFSIKYLTTLDKKLINGESVPNITGTLRNGTAFDLKTLQGNYVLIDFWGSWCAPCVEEMPQLHTLYDTYHAKKFVDANGFDMVSFGVEDDNTRWTSAMDRLKMNWQYQLTDFKNMKSPTVKNFGVTKVPTKFLINPKGIIVGVNMSPEDIEKYLSQHEVTN